MNNRLPVGNKEFGLSGSQETFYQKLCKSSWEVRENDDSRDMNELSACLITFTGSLYTFGPGLGNLLSLNIVNL